jgi:hypothetical protein
MTDKALVVIGHYAPNSSESVEHELRQARFDSYAAGNELAIEPANASRWFEQECEYLSGRFAALARDMKAIEACVLADGLDPGESEALDEMFETLTDFAWRDMSVCLSAANAYDGLHGTAFAADVNALMDNVRSDAELADGYHDYEVETAEEEAWLTEEPDDLPWDEPEFEFGAESESEAVDDASGESRRRVPDYIVGTEADYEAREALAEERRKRAREAEEAAIGGMSPREARNARAMGFGL